MPDDDIKNSNSHNIGGIPYSVAKPGQPLEPESKREDSLPKNIPAASEYEDSEKVFRHQNEVANKVASLMAKNISVKPAVKAKSELSPKAENSPPADNLNILPKPKASAEVFNAKLKIPQKPEPEVLKPLSEKTLNSPPIFDKQKTSQKKLAAEEVSIPAEYELPPPPKPLSKTGTFEKVALLILDGFGVAPPSTGNAVYRARIPTLNYLVNNYPAMTLQASGPLVGLPWGQMGNSESGHLNIGAGRIVGEDLPRITMAVQTGEFFKNQALRGAIEHCKKFNSKLHLLGLVSDGGVHSLDEHMFAILGLCQEMAFNRVFIHMFTDGRDTAERVALEEVKKVKDRIAKLGVGAIASVSGRFYAMDRGGHWNQTEMTYQVLVNGKGPFAPSAEDCIAQSYSKQIFDEMIVPTVIQNFDLRPLATIEENDAVIFFNFRQDRALQLTQMFIAPELVPESVRHEMLPNLYFCTMTEYAQNLPKANVAFLPLDLKNNLAEVLSKENYSQFHISESEKYAHVTSFFNCGRTESYPGEERKIVTSPDNARNYVDSPQMAADELTDILTQKITSTTTKFFVANYANCDMVGHTGNLFSAIKAVEFIDGCLKKIIDAVLLANAALIITADHGNVEEMISQKTGEINKDHTTNPVPCLFVSNRWKFIRPAGKNFEDLAAEIPGGVISDIAPTILELYGLPKPSEMTGINLLESLTA